MSFTILYLKSVLEKDLPARSRRVLELIKQAIEERLMVDPIGFGKPLRYNLKGCRRLRAGDYRIMYQIDKQVVTIIAVKHRKEVYEDA